jgi:peptidoglycan/LPS O-acetylase OafA/YrhL
MNTIKKYNDKTKIKKIYLGTEILRMILSFLIVVIHLHNKRGSETKFKSFSTLNMHFYVPTFFIISFYFSYKIFVSKNINKIKQRFIRILSFGFYLI